jgi:hypothetical protein
MIRDLQTDASGIPNCNTHYADSLDVASLTPNPLDLCIQLFRNPDRQQLHSVKSQGTRKSRRDENLQIEIIAVRLFRSRSLLLVGFDELDLALSEVAGIAVQAVDEDGEVDVGHVITVRM